MEGHLRTLAGEQEARKGRIVEKSAIFFSTGKAGKGFPAISGSTCSSEKTKTLHKYWIMTGIRAVAGGVTRGAGKDQSILTHWAGSQHALRPNRLAMPRRGKYTGTVLQRR